MRRKLIAVAIPIALIAIIIVLGIVLPKSASKNLFAPLIEHEENIDIDTENLLLFDGCDFNAVSQSAKASHKNEKLLVIFGDYLIAKNWQACGYDVLLYNQDDVAYFADAYEFFIKSNSISYSETRFIGNAYALEAAKYLCDQENPDTDIIPERIACFGCISQSEVNVIEAVYNAGIAIEIISNSDDMLLTPYATMLNLNDCNIDVANWYTSTLSLSADIKDERMNNSEEIVPSANTSVAYVLSRVGIKYLKTGNKFSSVNIEYATCGGVVYFDNECKNTFAISNRADNVRIELYLISGTEMRLMGACITDKSGIYRFDVKPIYANGFDEFCLIIYPPAKCILSTDSALETFIFPHMKSLSIINIGVKEI